MTDDTYEIVVRVIQSDPVGWFSIVEKTVWHSKLKGGGTWAECDGKHTLTMGDNQSSGTLRFKNSKDEYFLVALGVHKVRNAPEDIRWCDVRGRLKGNQTGVDLNPTYYSSNIPGSHPLRAEGETAKHNITVQHTEMEGNKSYATITVNSKPGV